MVAENFAVKQTEAVLGHNHQEIARAVVRSDLYSSKGPRHATVHGLVMCHPTAFCTLQN
jgi:hypothetical protein